MNFRLHGGHSVILMSVQPNAPYQDRFEEADSVLIYEGHDAPRNTETPEPKRVNQPEYLPSGRLTENGKFQSAAQKYVANKKGPDIVKVYEKIKKGIWSDNGYFHLADSGIEYDGIRNVFKFKLVAVEDVEDTDRSEADPDKEVKRSRLIATPVKLEVWKRDEGKCVMCGDTDDLHFDHIVPFSKGGTSRVADNIQLSCARHNLGKSAKIQ